MPLIFNGAQLFQEKKNNTRSEDSIQLQVGFMKVGHKIWPVMRPCDFF